MHGDVLSNSYRPRRRGVLLLAPLLLLSGCMKFNASYDIKDEEHVNANLTIAVSKSMAEMSGQNTGGELKECEQVMSAFGVTDKAATKRYEDDEYIGCTIVGEDSAKNIGTRDSGVAITFTDDEVRFRMGQEIFSPETSGQEITPEMLSDFKVSVTFPGTVTQHSGSSTVDGNTVTWTSAKELMSSGITATSERSSSALAWWMWLIIGVLALAVIGAVIAAVVRHRAKGSRANGSQGESVPHDPKRPDGGRPAQEGPERPGPEQSGSVPSGPVSSGSGQCDSGQPGSDRPRRADGQPQHGDSMPHFSTSAHGDHGQTPAGQEPQPRNVQPWEASDGASQPHHLARGVEPDADVAADADASPAPRRGAGSGFPHPSSGSGTSDPGPLDSGTPGA